MVKGQLESSLMYRAYNFLLKFVHFLASYIPSLKPHLNFVVRALSLVILQYTKLLDACKR